MRVYLSSIDTAPIEAQVPAQEGHANVLMSYYYCYSNPPGALKVYWEDFGNVFVDSGGFTARVQGAEISIEKYRDWLLEMEGHYSEAANLDTADMAESLQNQKVLEKAGIKAIPVYHVSEYDNKKLRPLIREWVKEYDHVAISLSKSAAHGDANLRRYLDYVFEATGTTVKVHGFSATAQKVLETYPFYSVDSTTYLASGKYSAYFEFRNGRLIRTDKPGVGGRKLEWTHGVTMPKLERMRRAVEAYMKLEEHLTRYWAKKGVVWE